MLLIHVLFWQHLLDFGDWLLRLVLDPHILREYHLLTLIWINILLLSGFRTVLSYDDFALSLIGELRPFCLLFLMFFWLSLFCLASKIQ